jgi:hypothetical protein
MREASWRFFVLQEAERSVGARDCELLAFVMLRRFLPVFIFGFLMIVLAVAMILGGSFGVFSYDARDDGTSPITADQEEAVEVDDPEKFKREIYIKLQSLVFPKVRLEGLPIGEAINVLQEQSSEINDGVSFGFVVRTPREGEGPPN